MFYWKFSTHKYTTYNDNTTDNNAFLILQFWCNLCISDSVSIERMSLNNTNPLTLGLADDFIGTIMKIEAQKFENENCY